MKKLIYLIVVIGALSLIVAGCSLPTVPASEESELDIKTNPSGCTTIQDGILTYSASHHLKGELLIADYDIFGYNYQAHMFNGTYANIYLGRAGFPPYEGDDEAYLAENPTAELHWAWPDRKVNVVMKWNDAWLSEKDCDGDGKLDRYFGFDSYIGSGAWLTNHMSGEYEGEDGKICKWTYFVKIVAVPADATLGDLAGYDESDDDPIYFWYAADGTKIGRQIWDAFAIIEEVENDPCAGIHGGQYLSPAGRGFDQYGPE